MRRKHLGRKQKLYLKTAVSLASVLAVAAVAVISVRISKKLVSGGKSGGYPETTLVFSFDPQTLVYDGTGTLDVLSGVTLAHRDGSAFDGDISASVRPSGTANRYTVLYSASEQSGAVANAERTLEVRNYSMPSISFDGQGEYILSSQLENAVSYFISKGLLSAQDGFGHDISNAVKLDVDSVLAESGYYTVTFSVENILGDTVTLSSGFNITVDGGEMIIILSSGSVTIPVGSSFNPYDYIVSASDPDDGDVTRLVTASGYVTTSTPGTYRISYSFVNSKGKVSPEAVLTVYVTG